MSAKYINTMSRIGKQPITLPTGVTATIADGGVEIKGPKGTLREKLHSHVQVAHIDDGLRITVANVHDGRDKALWGLFGSLLRNMIVGVITGYQKQLEINGVGYKVALQGKNLVLHVGYSHPVTFPLPEGITAGIEKNVITINGIDKQLVGETAARIRKIRKPEPYKGKGIKYMDEVLRRKAGKAAKTAK